MSLMGLGQEIDLPSSRNCDDDVDDDDNNAQQIASATPLEFTLQTQEVVGDGGGGGLTGNVGAVSYTHLTLPTIYSV